MLLLWISVIFLSLYGYLLFFYRKNWQSLSNFEVTENVNRSFISVIISARNEEKKIGNLIDSLKVQSYPQSSFEIIVADDFSTDKTAAIVKEFELSNLRLMQPGVQENVS